MLIFVRHALSKGNVHHFDQRQMAKQLHDEFNYQMYPGKDPDITDIVGKQQAKEAGRFFKQWMEETGIKPDKVIISPFLRTIHTASIFLKEAGYEGKVILEPLIREYSDICPSTNGTEKTALIGVIQESEHLLKDWDVNISLLIEERWFSTDKEHEPERQERAQEVLDKYLNDNDKIVLAFSHGGLGMKMSGFERIRNCEIIKFEKGCPPESLFDPTLGIKDEPTLNFPPAP